VSRDPQIGRTLAALRVARGWTQGELGERSGVAKAQISRYERGADTPAPRTLSALLDGLGVALPQFRHLMDVLGRLLEGRGPAPASVPWLPEDLEHALPGFFGRRAGEGAEEGGRGGADASDDTEVERLAQEAADFAARLVRLHFRRLEPR
jgi:transcriptional regulator with XRE-family HTH domain